MAWNRKPLPGTSLRREVMGRRVKFITSGVDETVGSHSQWLLTEVSPPLFEQMTVMP